jgi:endonuclease/exonuclease/phosphatase family metal-dependent hydrolase
MTKESKEYPVIYPTIDEIKELNFEGYCAYLGDFEKVRKSDYCDQLIYIPSKEKFVYRIATYNVHNFVNIDNTLDLIENADLDFICLQEVYPYPSDPSCKIIEGNFDYLKNKMKSIGFIDCYIVNSMLGKNPSKLADCYYPLTNAFFSKKPLINCKNYYLEGNRTVLFVETNIGPIKVLVVGTHLGHSTKNDNSSDNVSSDAKDLIKYIEKEEKERNISNIILLGDLNNQYNHPSLSPIFDRFRYGYEKKTNSFLRREVKDYILVDSSEIFPSYSHSIHSGHSDHLLLFNDFIHTDAEKDLVSSLNKKYLYLKINSDGYEDNAVIQKEFYPKKKYLKVQVSAETINNSHFNFDQWYSGDDIELLGKTKLYQYHEAIKILFDTYGGSRLKNLYKYSYKLSGYYLNSKNLSEDETVDLEEILFHYIKTRPNMKTIILWPTSGWYKKNDILRNTLQFLKSKGNIFYQKKVDFNYYQAANLIFHLYMTTSRNKNMNHIDFNTQMKGWKKTTSTTKYPILIIFYEYNGNQNDITGSNAYFKTELRSFFTKATVKELRNYDILHINDFYSETLDNAGLFLNENSLEILKNANIFKLTKIINDFNVYAINSYKKILHNNFSLLEIERFILTGCFVIFTYGTKSFGDLDGTVLYDPVPDESFLKKYQTWFDITGNNYQPYIDLTMQNTLRYKDFIGVFKNKIAKILGARNLRELILNPKYHYYFFGLKTIILPYELIQKVFRFRPKSLVDIIKVGDIIKKKFKIPKIPSFVNDPFYYKENMSKTNILKIMENYFKTHYFEKITSTDILTKYVSNKPVTIDTYLDNTLKDRYLFFHCLGYASTHPFLKNLPFEHQLTAISSHTNTKKTKTKKTNTKKTNTKKTNTKKTKTKKTKKTKTKNIKTKKVA